MLLSHKQQVSLSVVIPSLKLVVANFSYSDTQTHTHTHTGAHTSMCVPVPEETMCQELHSSATWRGKNDEYEGETGRLGEEAPPKMRVMRRVGGR